MRVTGYPALILAACLAASAGSEILAVEQVVLQASRDNTLFEYDGSGADRSDGAGPTFFVGRINRVNASQRRGLIAFDIAGSIPPGATILGATLSLHLGKVPPGGPAATSITLYRMLSDWGQGCSNSGGFGGQGAPATMGDATWRHRFFNSLCWSNSCPSGNNPDPLGGAAAAFDHQLSGQLFVGRTLGTYDCTDARMASDVQAWLDTPASNFGWILIGDEATMQSARLFDSRESSVVEYRPYLTVIYTTPAPAGACCANGGGCAIEPATSCASQGGIYKGDASTCEACHPPGACCLPNTSCSLLSQSDCICQGGVFEGEDSSCLPNPCALLLTPFVDELTFPSTAQPVSGLPGEAASYSLPMLQFTHRFHSALPLSTVWGYGGSLPGPTIEASVDQPVTVTWSNDLRDSSGTLLTTHHLEVDTRLHGPDMAGTTPRTVVHLHGGHVPAAYDGYPEDSFLPGQSDVYTYPNHQRASTLWYHDHALGITRLNVYMGLAGFYLIRDPAEAALGLPSGDNEKVLMIQDKSINPATGELEYPAMWDEHVFGDTIAVNGTIWPYMNVSRGKYRFRVVDASGSRAYTLLLSSGAPFFQIGTDGGLLTAPVSVNQITLLPGERADLVIDFAGYAPGTNIILANSAPAPYPGTPGEGVIPYVMQFRVTSEVGDTDPLPTSLSTVVPLLESSAVQHRDFDLVQCPNPLYPACDPTSVGTVWTINGLSWDQLTETPTLGTTEVWAFRNRSGFSHPMHMHLVMFQILDRQQLDGAGLPIGPRVPPAPNEAGWKDTVQSPPGHVTRVIARFLDYQGVFPYHCHILEHEDHEMMRKFQTLPCSCDDGNACTTNDSCDTGSCVGGPPPICDDGVACTDDSCNAQSGCVHAPNAALCSDGNPCTDDVCSPVSGCVHPNNTASCDDLNPCTSGETCQGGLCLSPSNIITVGSPLSVGTGPTFVASADVNGDGKIDLAVANSGSNNVSVLLGNGSFGFSQAAGSPVAVGAQPSSLAFADFNGDLKPDMAVSNSGAGTVSVLLGNGAGGFAAAPGSPVAVGLQPVALAAGDVNGDGLLDLAVANSGANTVSVLLGNGAGGFAPAPGPAVGVGTQPLAVVAADLNRDGKLDLAVANSGSNTLTILLGNGSGGFTPTAGSPLSVGTAPRSLAVGDLNGDGLPDLGAANSGSNNVTILLGDGAGAFAPSAGSPFGAGSGPGAIAFGDLNRDGLTDLITTNAASNTVTILVGDGAGRFAESSSSPLATGLQPVSVAVADLNGDGALDLTIANSGSNNLSLRAVGPSPLEGSACTAASTCISESRCRAGDCTWLSLGQTALPPLVIGSSPRAIVAGDVNGDGKLDLVVPRSTHSDVAILLGDGKGGLVASPGWPASGGTTPAAVALGDYNRDGKLDLAVANQDSDNLRVLVGNGLGQFAPTALITVGSHPVALAAADLNNDGKMDLAVLNEPPGNVNGSVSILLGTGGGTFVQAAGSPFSVNTSPESFAVGDLNGDGKKDLVVAHGTGAVSILLGNGAGVFSPPSPAGSLPPSSGPHFVTLADLNRDGKLDLVATSAGTGEVVIFIGDGAGHLTALPVVAIGGAPRFAAVDDFNGDGRYDLVVANPATGQVVLLAGDGTGRFTQGTGSVIPAGPQPVALAVGDLNRDGRSDVAVIDQTSADVRVLLGGPVYSTQPAGYFNLDSGTPFTVLSMPVALSAADFNSDGKLDFAVVSQAPSPAVTIYSRNLNGFWVSAGSYLVGASPSAIADGDLNRDGKTDLVIANTNSNSFSILLGNGVGGFSSSSVGTGTAPLSVALGDLNGDGKLDAVTANSGSNSVSVLLGDGSGGFSHAAGSPISVGGDAVDAAISDLNMDGKPDLAVACYLSGSVIILLGNGSGGFSQAVGSPISISADPVAIVAGDFNRDGKPDVATADRGSNNVKLLIGNGIGQFSVASTTSVGTHPWSLTAGDLDLDGKLDLAVANFDANSVSVLLGNGLGGFSQNVGSPALTAQFPRGILAMDFSGDGRPDLAVVHDQSSGLLTILNNASAGTKLAANGTPCNDGSTCTAIDTCQFGTCVGQNPATPATWYRDADGDGYGTAAESLIACTQPAGFVANHTDCNDTQVSIHPNAPESCGDGIDQDCDGLVDCNDPSCASSPACCTDSDDDHYFRQGGICQSLADCDDHDPDVHPGALEGDFATCSDHVDNDCDGRTDCNDTACGGVVNPPCACIDSDGDGYSPYASCGAQDCDDSNRNIHPGAEEFNDGLDSNCNGVADELTGRVQISSDELFCFDAQVGAFSYQIVRSLTSDFSSGCTVVTVGYAPTDLLSQIVACARDPFNPLPGTAVYYLVRPLTLHKGSWGVDSSGVERTGGCLPP